VGLPLARLRVGNGRRAGLPRVEAVAQRRMEELAALKAEAHRVLRLPGRAMAAVGPEDSTLSP
jgi:hypothetical protein